MHPDLERRSSLALAVYERAASVMAARAGSPWSPWFPQPSPFAPLIDTAEKLAMPGTRHKEQQLPVLTSLLGHVHNHRRHGYYSPCPLPNAPAALLPAEERPSALDQAYQNLWAAFEPERQHLLAPGRTAHVQELGYHGLLQRMAWAMPAPGIDDSDISLFDFARVSAALAVCLDGRPPTAVSPPRKPAAHPQHGPVAILIGGEIAGLHEWLYTIGSHGAARSLRGRSVYIQLLSEIVALWLLNQLGLPACNLLYVGGGNFFVLAPPLPAERILLLRRAITERLLAMHGGALYLAVAHTNVSEAELLNGTSGEIWGRVFDALYRCKRQRFVELDDAGMARAIGKSLPGTGALQDNCAICRRPIVPGEQAQVIDEEEDEIRRRCELCDSFSELGRHLPKSEFLVVAELPPEQEYQGQRINTWQQGLRAFGCDVQFLADAHGGQSWTPLPGSDLVRIYSWHQVGPNQFPGSPDPYSSVWLYRPLAQAAPIRHSVPGQPVATFDELHAEGIQRWGILRMDMDQAGDIFRRGLPGSSLSRIVGLSAQMRLLYESYVPALLEQYNEAHPESTYLIFIGGDDLLIVAGWSHLPDLAFIVRKAVVAFAVANPKVSISGGISIARDDNFPIYQAERAAAAAQDLAKSSGRSRLVFLGQAIPWSAKNGLAYERIRHRVHQLARWTGTNGLLPRSFLMRLQAIDNEWQAGQARQAGSTAPPHSTPAGTPIYLGPWQWHLVYGLHRAVENVSDSTIQSAVKNLVNDIIAGEIQFLGLEARWTELLTRRKDDQRNGQKNHRQNDRHSVPSTNKTKEQA